MHSDEAGNTAQNWLFPKLGFAAAYLVMAGGAFVLSGMIAPIGMADPWHLSAGVSMAFLLLFGAWMFPLVLLSSFANEFWLRGPSPDVETAILLALIGAGIYTIAALGLRRIRLRVSPAALTRRVFLFCGFAVGAALLVATAGALTIWSSGVIDQEQFFRVLLKWWLGDSISILTLTPILCLVGFSLQIRSERLNASAEIRNGFIDLTVSSGREWFEYFWWIGLAVGLGALAAILYAAIHLDLFFTMFLPLIVLAVRKGLGGAVIGNLVMGVGGLLVMMAAGRKAELNGIPEADLSGFLSFVGGGLGASASYEFFYLILTMSVAFLILGAVITESREYQSELENARELLHEQVTERTRELKRTNRELKKAVHRYRSTLEALQEKELSYRKLFEENLAGVFRSLPCGRILDCNPAFAAMFGYESREEVLGIEAPQFYFSAGERDAHFEKLRRDGKSVNAELRGRRKDGSEIWLLENLSLQTLADGTEILEGTVIDISEQKKLEERLRHARVLEGLGTLSGGVAHEFNNLMTSVIGFSELALERAEPDSQQHSDLTRILDAGRKAAGLTQQLLAFGRRQFLQPQDFDLNAFVQEMGDSLKEVLGRAQILEVRVATDPIHVIADLEQLKSVVKKLVINSRDATAFGDRIRLETAKVTVSTADGLELEPGEYGRLTIRDTGPGMDEETRSRIFYPFFSTKPMSPGRGLGLASVYGVIRQSGGDILVTSRVGVGSVLRLFLPLAQEGGDRVLPSQHAAEPQERLKA